MLECTFYDATIDPQGGACYRRRQGAGDVRHKGSNLLGVAYSKAAEMASTLKDSGSGVRPPFTGELGWQGGVVAKGKAGILIASFSGGRSEDDVKISKAGLGVLAGTL